MAKTHPYTFLDGVSGAKVQNKIVLRDERREIADEAGRGNDEATKVDSA